MPAGRLPDGRTGSRQSDSSSAHCTRTYAARARCLARRVLAAQRMAMVLEDSDELTAQTTFTAFERLLPDVHKYEDVSHIHHVLDRLLSDELRKKNRRVLGKCLSICVCGPIVIALTARTSPPSFGVCSRSMASILVVARQPTAGEPAAPVVTSSSLTPTPRTSMLRLRCSGSYPSISRSDPESSMPTVNAHPNLLTVTRSSY